MNVYFTGFRGSGKTTVGRLLATRIGWPFLDTDAIVVERAEKPICEVFEIDGEETFRRFESDAISQVAQLSGHVVSLGGGACEREANRDRLRESGKVIWLTADAETLWARIENDEVRGLSRPALSDQSGLAEVQSLLEKRHTNYASSADFVVDTIDVDPEELVQRCIQIFESL